MRLVFGQDYPSAPPKGARRPSSQASAPASLHAHALAPGAGIFVTKIFHPNVSKAGEICVNTLKRDWTPSTGLRHILVVVRCLLIEPNPESALNEEAGRLLLEDYQEYAQRAQLMTSIHAQPPRRCVLPMQCGSACIIVQSSVLWAILAQLTA